MTASASCRPRCTCLIRSSSDADLNSRYVGPSNGFIKDRHQDSDGRFSSCRKLCEIYHKMGLITAKRVTIYFSALWHGGRFRGVYLKMGGLLMQDGLWSAKT